MALQAGKEAVEEEAMEMEVVEGGEAALEEEGEGGAEQKAVEWEEEAVEVEMEAVEGGWMGQTTDAGHMGVNVRKLVLVVWLHLTFT